ncbi:chromosome-partitioning ATPase Soj [Roseovarius mucosus]|uniref:Chromosome-partitioning ATPase Soj n=1 Tax=Roseovarius mucosus TaxID=215743 RepID=A0A1V0RRI1_9RHOB|nr:ParA family partition ATPase [Roseovarius mucosus]ARE84380.1 chromosome-partitioning ATPase Soj [Roseovarius mucosus]
MIICFINQKGGSGKTSLSINVASTLARLGYSVLLIDADRQASSSAWVSLREETAFQVVSMARPNFAKDAKQMALKYDFTIIDGPPHAEEISRSCIAAADLVLIPIEPSGLSIWASEMTIRQVQEVSEYKDIRAAFVISRKISRTIIGRQIYGMSEGYGPPVLTSHVHQRVAFAECLTLGKSIHEYEPRGLAAVEIQQLTNEILNLIETNFPIES